MNISDVEKLLLFTFYNRNGFQKNWAEPIPVDRHCRYITPDFQVCYGDSITTAPSIYFGVGPIQDEDTISLEMVGALISRVSRTCALLNDPVVSMRESFTVKDRGIKMLECALSIYEAPVVFSNGDQRKMKEPEVSV